MCDNKLSYLWHREEELILVFNSLIVLRSLVSVGVSHLSLSLSSLSFKWKWRRQLTTESCHPYGAIYPHLFFYYYYFNWSIIALQCCFSFCCRTWISYMYTQIPSLLSRPLLPHPTPLGHHRELSRTPCAAQWLPTNPNTSFFFSSKSILHIFLFFLNCGILDPPK